MRSFLLSGDERPVTGDVVVLDDEESRHLLKVLRAEDGAALRLVDGRGHRCDGVLTGRVGRRARVELTDVRADPEESAPPRLCLACGVVKGRRWEFALEKAVECGAHAIVPLLTERGVVEPGAKRRARWLTVLRAALKQSERCLLPDLGAPVALSRFLADPPPGPLVWGAVPAERTVAPGRSAEPKPGAPAPAWLTVLVGPEGGWTAEERERLTAAGATPVDLGPHVLRSETAAVAALTLAQVWRARWRTA